MRASATRGRQEKAPTRQIEFETNYAQLTKTFSQLNLDTNKFPLLKVAVVLWTVAAVLLICSSFLKPKDTLSDLKVPGTVDIDKSILKPQTHQWTPRADSQVQPGALPGGESWRLNGTQELQQILNEKPAGFNTPYRTQ